jgi:hypothetical protein
MSLNPYEAPAPVPSSGIGAGDGVSRSLSQFRPANSLAPWASWWLLITAIVEGLMTIPMFFLDPYLNTDPDLLELDLGWSSELVVALFAGVVGYACLTVVANITGIVLFLMFKYRASKNARALGAKAMTITPGWAVGWYFIPFMNLFKPYQAMKEIYQASEPTAGALDWKEATVPGFLGWWWGFWIVSNILSQAELRLSLREELGGAEFVPWLSLINGAVGVVGAFLVFHVIRSLHRLQLEKAAWQRTLKEAIPPVVGQPGDGDWNFR